MNLLPWSSERAPRLPYPLRLPSCALRPAREDDPRVGQVAGRALSPGEWPCIGIIGFCSDEGIRRAGGRTGARQAPDRIREAFYRLVPPLSPGARAILERTHDFGNLDVEGDLEGAQLALADVIAACLAGGTLPLVLGGGHETTFGHFLGYTVARQRVALVNIDAHADVRPLVDGRGHSGSSFRQALTHAAAPAAGYTVAGLQHHAVAAAHVSFLAEHGARVIWAEDLTEEVVGTLFAAPAGTSLLASFDLDAVDQAFAPGVSAPATGGLPPHLWLSAARHAGRSSAVTSLDIVELSPDLDRDAQTTSLAALTMWRFVQGVGERDVV